MTQEQYHKAKIIQEEIEQLQDLLGENFRSISTIVTYNRNYFLGEPHTREFRISNDLSKDITEVIKDRLNKLQIEMANL